MQSGLYHRRLSSVLGVKSLSIPTSRDRALAIICQPAAPTARGIPLGAPDHSLNPYRSVFPADCLHSTDCHCATTESLSAAPRVPGDTQVFQHMAKFY